MKRVYEVFDAKVFVPDEDLLRPGPTNLSPKAKALFDVLFPNGVYRIESSHRKRGGLT